MKALVTGVAGFVGSAIARRLAEHPENEIVGIDAMTDYYDRRLKLNNLQSIASSRFTFVEGDLNSVDLGATLQNIEVVFHQAGQPGVRKSWGADFAQYTHDNVNATQRLLEAVRHAPSVRRVVYASSSSVYGDAERYPTLESDLPRPLSPYGVSKLAAEHLMSLYARNFGVPTVSLRYFTVYGPGQRPDMAFTRFLQAAYLGNQINVYGDGEQIRDFTYIEDIVSANLLAAQEDVPAGQVMNVAGGSSISVNEVLEVIRDVSGRPVRVEYLPAVSGDVRQTGGATELIRSSLGWTPRTSIEEGLQAHWEWTKAVN